MSGALDGTLDGARKLADGKHLSGVRARALLDRIEAARVEAGITVSDLARHAGVTRDCVANLRAGRRSGRAATLRKLAKAIDGARDAAVVSADTDRLRDELALAGLTLRLQQAGIVPARARRVAVYLGHVELGLSQARVAALAGVTPQAVSKTVRHLENQRDDPAFEALITRIVHGDH